MSASGVKLVKNAFYNGGSWIILILLSVITTPYMVNKLNIEGYGIYALFSGLFGYYGLLDLGLGQGIIKFIAQYKIEKNNKAINSSVNAALLVQIITGIIASSALLIFAEPILTLFKISNHFWYDAKLALYATALGFFLTMISGTLSSILMGLQKYDITSKVNVITNAFLTVIIVLLLYSGYSLRYIMYANVLSSLLVFFIYFVLAKKELPEWKINFEFDKTQLKLLFNFSGYLFLSKIASVFNNYLTRTILGIILGPSAVTYYDIPMKIITAFRGFLNNLTTVLFPFASELKSLECKERLQNIYLKASTYIAILAFPVYFILILFSKEILGAWMGKDFAANSWLVMSLLSAAYLLSALTLVPSNITIGLGYVNIISNFSLISLTLNIIFVTVLTELWAIKGTALAVLIVQLLALVFIIYITKKVFNISLTYFFRKVFSFHIIFFSIIIILYFLLTSYIHIHNACILFSLIFFILYITLVNIYYLPYKNFIKIIINEVKP